MIEKIRKFIIKNKYMLAAFFVPAGIMALTFITEEFFPFGENQLAVVDMYHQYVPFLNELQYKLQHMDSLLYSWNGAGGTNFVSLMAYYTASPLNLLLILFPQKFLMEGVTVILLIKIGLAGLFMNIYFKGMFGRQDSATVAFSTLYALCAYVMGFYWNIMWMDGFALLPLCILGLNRLMDKGEVKLYIITLALMMFTNYYIGGMMCIFIFCYFPVLYFSKKRDLGVRGCLETIGRGVLASLSGILLSAFLLVPTFLSLQNTYYIDSTMPEELSFYRSIMEILNNLLPHMEVTIRSGAPNIYCGMFCVMLFAYFLICEKITVRKKFVTCALLAFMILSLNINKLDYIWHGLHFPNQIPFRWSFAVSFVLVITAYEAFTHLRYITPKTIGGIAAAGTAYIVIAEKMFQEDMKPAFAYVALLMLFLYSGFMALYRMKGFEKKLVKLLLLLLVMFEMVISADAALDTVGNSSRTSYFRHSDSVHRVVEDIKAEDTGFYRMEMANSITLNSPMLYNYPGVSQFSSTVNETATNFMVSIGIEGGGPKNRFSYAVTNPVTDAILGVKYYIGRGSTIDNESSFELIREVDGTCLYENKYALPMGYMTEPALVNAWEGAQDNPYHALNQYVKLATGTEEDVFVEISDPQVASSGAEIGEEINGFFECSFRGDSDVAKVELTYTIPETQQVYAFVESESVDYIKARRSDGTEILLPTDVGGITSIGEMEAGETLTITIAYQEEKAGNIESYIYGLDEEVWENAYNILNDETLEVTSHSDTKIRGTINVKEDGICIISVPYERGWTLKVDGQKKEVQLLNDCMIAVPLDAGEHDIQLKFVPYGTVPGIALTLAGGAIFAFLCARKRKYSDNC